MKWDTSISNRLIELIENNTYKTVADILSSEFGINCTPTMIDGKLQRMRKQAGMQDLESLLNSFNNSNLNNTNIQSNIQSNTTNNMFTDDCYELSDCNFTYAKVESLKQTYNILTELNPKKILSLSDLHAPLINFKAVEQAIENNLDADICVLNGDVFDGNCFSTFAKFKNIDFKKEIDQVYKLLDVLTNYFDKVVWVGGNHDLMRFKNFISRNNGNATEYLIDVANPLKIICDKYHNLINVDHDWTQIGDVIFSHLQDFSTVDMKTVTTVNEKFEANKYELLPNPDYKAIVNGHTHHLGKIYKNNKLLIEQGCLCHLQDYRFMKPAKNKWQTGYAVVYMDNGKCDFNKTNIFGIF